jgi:hypothetical protein
MYSVEYLNFIAKLQLPIEYHDVVANLSEIIIPSTGILKYSISDIAAKINVDVSLVEKIIDSLSKTTPPMVKVDGRNLLFHYDKKDVDSVRHYRNAISNIGLMDLFG